VCLFRNFDSNAWPKSGNGWDCLYKWGAEKKLISLIYEDCGYFRANCRNFLPVVSGSSTSTDSPQFSQTERSDDSSLIILNDYRSVFCRSENHWSSMCSRMGHFRRQWIVVRGKRFTVGDKRISAQRNIYLHRCKEGFDCSWIACRNLSPSYSSSITKR
jgi:hypothetical protein